MVESLNYTKYEKVRIIGARARQISLGAPILIETSMLDPIRIALEEMKKEVIPITVVRE